MARRIAAAVFAVAVIAGALAIRNADDADEAPPRAATSTTAPYEVFRDDPVTLLCAEELARLCADMKYLIGTAKVEPAWVTVDRLAAGGQLGADAWATFRPLDEIAVPPSPAQSVLGPATPVGRSAVVLVGPPAAVAAVDAACPNPRMLLSCAGEAEGVQLMLRDPTTSPAGAIALAVLADELGGEAAPPAGAVPSERLVRLLARSRGTPSPYEDVVRLKGSAVALTFEGDVNLALDVLKSEERFEYDRVVLRYPFETRAAEIALVPSRSFARARDLAAVLGSEDVGFKVQRQTGFDPPGYSRSNYPPKVFSARPPIRYDLPPPAPERLRQLRALPRAGSAIRTGP